MALIPHAQLDQVVRNAVALDLNDLSRQAEHAEREARARVEQILAEGEQQRQCLLSGAQESGRAEGHAQGHAEGLEQGRAEGKAAVLAELAPQLQAMEAAWVEALQGFEQNREAMLGKARHDVLQLALEIARRVTHRSIECDPDAVLGQIGAVLDQLTRPTTLRLAVHPADAPLVRETLPTLLSKFENAQHAEVHEDDTLRRGSVVARTASGGVLDASVAAQLDRIVEELLPDESQDAAGGMA